MSSNYNQAGFGLIEIIVAMGLLVIVAATGATTIIGSFSTNRLGNEETDATLYAQEGLEAARSLRKQDWDTTFIGTDCSSGCGLSAGGGSWTWSGSSNTKDVFTRVVTVADAERDGSGNLVSSGGTADGNTKLVTSTVSWDFAPTRQNSVSVAAYFTNFVKAIGGDWASPSVLGSLDLSGNQNALKVAVSGNYAYVVRGGSPDFSVVDISNSASPTLVGSLDLDGNPTDLVVNGSYAYVSSESNSQELQIVSIATPASPSLAGSLNLNRNTNLLTVWANGTTIYAGRASSNQEPELYVINASNPASPSLIGSLEMGSDVNHIAGLGSTLYLAMEDNAAELAVINASVPAVPVQVTTRNISGNKNGVSIAVNTGQLVVGDSSGDITTYSLPTLITPTQQGTYTAGQAVNDISFNDDGRIAFLGTDENTQDFQIIDISTLASPSLIGSLDLSGNLNGLVYDETLDIVVAVGDSNSSEVEIIGP